MSLATLHYMGANGVRACLTTESAGPLHLPALEISARIPVYVCSIDDEGRLLVVRYHGGRIVGETIVEPEGAVTQVQVHESPGARWPFCPTPCEATLTPEDIARGARDYSGNLVCGDCYARLCEDAEDDRRCAEAQADYDADEAAEVGR